VINFLLLALFIVYSNQKALVSELNTLKTQNTNIDVPTTFARLVESASLMCTYYKMNCKDLCVSQSVCDSEDPSHSWKFQANSDGTYHILNKKEGRYVNSAYKSGENWDIAVLSKTPQKFNLVPSKTTNEVFFIKPNNNQNLCFVTVDGNFQTCREEEMYQLYFFETSDNEEVLVPNTFYSIKWIAEETRRIEYCWTSSGTDYQFCSFQGPDMGFKFVPQNDATFMVINGIGLAAEAIPHNPGKFGVDQTHGYVSFRKQDPNNHLQRWRVLRTPHYPDNVIFKLPSVDYYVYNNALTVSANLHKLNTLHKAFFYLGEACSERVVNDNTWYLLREYNQGGPEQCLHFNKAENRVFFDVCKYNDYYMFKFVWDSESHGYYIYNKSQGEKVLSVHVEDETIVNSKSGIFLPKVTGNEKQLWNTTTRHVANSMGFFIYNRIINGIGRAKGRERQRGIKFSGYENGIAPLDMNFPIWAESFDFVMNNKDLLSPLCESAEILGVPPIKPPKCNTQVL